MATHTGLPLPSTAAITSCRFGACSARGVLNSLMSAPPEKNLPPPVMTMPRTASSALAAAMASARPWRTARPRPLTGGLSKVTTAMPSRSVVVTDMSWSTPWFAWKGWCWQARRSWAAPRAFGEAPAEPGEHRHLFAKARRVGVGGHAGARARADALQDRRQPEQVVGKVEVPVRADVETGAAGVGLDVVAFTGDAQRVEVQAAESGQEAGRDVPAHQVVGEVGQRMTERGQLPVQHRAHPPPAAVEHQVVEAEVAVHQGHRFVVFGRHVVRQPGDQALHVGDVAVAAGHVLARPAA